MDLQAELSNEVAAQFYGFSPLAFSDEVYNRTIDAYKRMIESMLEEPIFAEVRDSREFRQKLTNALFKGNHLSQAITKLSEESLKYVFRIPECVTLPEHRATQELPEDFDMELLKKEIRELEEEMTKKRVILKKQQLEERDIADSLVVLREIEAVLEKEEGDLSRVSIDDGDESVTTTADESQNQTADSTADEDNDVVFLDNSNSDLAKEVHRENENTGDGDEDSL